MAPRLKLPENFQARTFGSTRNMHGLEKYLLEPMLKEVTHIFETRLSDSLLGPKPRFLSLSKATIVLAESPDPMVEVVSDEMQKSKQKRGKIPLATVTRRWQEVSAYKFTWAEGEFNASSNLMGVVCKSCSNVSGQKKVMGVKGDNLKKHEGRRTFKFDGEPLPHLKTGDTYVECNCKHLQYQKEWVAQCLAGTNADQLVADLEGEASKKRVQFLHNLSGSKFRTSNV